MSKAGLHRLITKSFAYHMNRVPFTWNYFGNETKMLFVGGLFGVSFDEKESSLTPIFGYSICEDKVELDPRKQE
jgi:hypothetical protein